MRADLVTTLAQVVAKLPCNVFFDLRFAHAGTRPKDGGGYGLRAFNAFRVVVRYDGGLFGKMQGFFQCGKCPPTAETRMAEPLPQLL